MNQWIDIFTEIFSDFYEEAIEAKVDLYEEARLHWLTNIGTSLFVVLILNTF